MNRRKLIASLVAIVTIALGGVILNVAFDNDPTLGLDLQGGISVTQQPVGDYEPEALDLAVERIRERVDGLGVAEPEIVRQGDAIVVNLPGVSNQQEAIDLVQVTGQVYLRPVIGCANEGVEDPAPTTTVPGTTVPATTAAPGPSRAVSGTGTTAPDAPGATTTEPTDAATTTAPDAAGATTTAPDGTTAPDEAPLTTQVVSDPTQQQVLPLQGGGQCLVGPAQGTGAVFTSDARADILQTSGWGVVVGLRAGGEGRDVWNAIAGQCFARAQACPSGRLAIELDGEVVSAPTVNQPSFTTGVEITGAFSEDDARQLARVLKSGSLPVRMETQSVQNVSPTLGQDSLRAAIVSGVIGVALVMVLLILYYGVMGLIAVGGILVSAGLLYTMVALLSATQGLTLSLAGVAGIILSAGVTVDSYVVFFERLKDELRSGKTLRNSAQRGFAGAWRTILIANIVSLIGAFTLWYLTVGGVRNFAFFLGLSTLVGMAVAYFFARPTILLLSRTTWLSRRKVMGLRAPATSSARHGAAPVAGGAS